MPTTTKKPTSRAALMEQLRKALGADFHIKESEDFDGREKAIWISGESYSELIQDCPFEYYGTEQVNPTVGDILDKAGWYFEFYDPGTVMLYKD